MLKGNEAFMKQYMDLRRVSKETERIYLNAVLSFERITGKTILEIDKDSITKWYSRGGKLGDDVLAANTLAKYASILRRLYAHHLTQTGETKRVAKIHAEEMFDLIAFTDLYREAEKDTALKNKLVSREEFETLMSSANSVRMKALIAITYDAGARKGEIIGLRIRDVKVKPSHWEVMVSGKTGDRTIPLTESVPYLRAWLEVHPERKPDQYLFVTHRKGVIKQMNPNSFNTGLNLLTKKTGLSHIHPHMLRHTRLTVLAGDTNIGDHQLKSFAGWKPSSAMADRYIHLTGKEHINAVLGAQGIEPGKIDVRPLMASQTDMEELKTQFTQMKAMFEDVMREWNNPDRVDEIYHAMRENGLIKDKKSE